MSDEGPSTPHAVHLATIGGLVHDLGKLWAQVPRRERSAAHWDCATPQRPFAECDCRRRYRYAHAPLGARLVAALFGDASPYVELAVLHHAEVSHIPLARCVQRGDWLSAGERDERYDPAGDERPGEPLLLSPLADTAHPLRLQPRALADPWPPVCPEPGDRDAVASGYATLVERLRQVGTALQALDGDARVDAVLGLVENVATLIPSAFHHAVPDISLAAHLHHAGAFAGALAACGDPEADPVATLVMGDLSGIQWFLHRAASARAARQLRARSFYLALISQMVARTIARRLGVTPAHVLFASGGNFAVLAPPGAGESLSPLAAEINALLRQTHGAGLEVVLAGTSIAADEAGRFGEVMERGRRALDAQKLRRFDVALTPDLFAPTGVGGAAGACAACGADAADAGAEDERLCAVCAGLVDLGTRLPRSAYLTIAPIAPAPLPGWRRFFGLLGWELDLWPDVPPPQAERSVIALDAEALAQVAYARLLVAGKYVPTRSAGNHHAVVDFAELARRGPGRPLLACAKLDVDDLGAFFARLRQEGRNTPSRIASASRFLSLFFEGYINFLAAGRPDQDLYIIYSGGDDAAFVGHWTAVLDFVRQLRADFAAWTGDNPRLRFSAGIALGAEARPLILALTEAEELLALAKRQEGKDRCALFGLPFRWHDVDAVRHWEQRLAKAVARAALARGLLQTLQEAFAAVDPADPLGPPVYGPALWRIPYRVRRAVERDRSGALDPGLVEDIERALLDRGGAARLAVAARLAEWRTHR